MTVKSSRTIRRLGKMLGASIITLTCQLLLIDTTLGAWFEDVTNTARLTYSGPSFGASWGDLNGDAWPDLWVSNHGAPPKLYLNNKDGTFTNSTGRVDYAAADMHGAAWADFDNDGDQDLLLIVGGVSGAEGRLGPNQLFVNSNGLMREEASARGIDYAMGRGRSPLWFDWNNDGFLDVFISNIRRSDGQAPSALFAQQDGHFTNTNDLAAILDTNDNEFAQLFRIMDQNIPTLISGAIGYPDHIYRYNSLPFQEMKDILGVSKTPNTKDVAIADLNGDLRADLYLTRSKDYSSAVNTDSRSINSRIIVNSDEKGILFRSTGNIRFQIGPSHLIRAPDIYIGSAGTHPLSNAFSLSKTDPATHGIASHVPGSDFGVFIGYDQGTDFWSLYVSKNSHLGLNIAVYSSTALTDLATLGFNSVDGGVADRLLLQHSGVLVDTSSGSGTDTASPCVSVSAADFDNDMDIDLYLVCRGPAINQDNILYENLGDGSFRVVANAGGAQGSSLGLGESVVAADYDQDGFVDLFVTNGSGGYPLNKGPSQLYRNLGGTNSWLEVDLEGTRSNRDGIGAKLLATVGGATQLREQTGGAHRFAQDHQRVHFGLADNQVVDQLVIEWPSGVVQNLYDIPANQIIRVIEPGLPPIYGRPAFLPGQSQGVYIWKETFDGPYRLRVNGDGQGYNYTIKVITDTAFDSVSPYQLSGNDILEWNSNHLSLDGGVSVWEDGIDFALQPNTKAFISVEQDGVPNPRQLHIGSSGMPLSPSGWIVKLADLPVIPGFAGGKDLGMFIGSDSSGNSIHIRWNGDGLGHRAETELLFSEPVESVTRVSFESSDTLVANANSVVVGSYVSSWWDGIDINVKPESLIGMSYSQDALVQPYRINPLTRDLGLPNAYRLPLADSIGQPAYNSAAEAGLFIWKDQTSNHWHLRAMAGGGNQRYIGEIVSTANIRAFEGYRLEPSDTAIRTAPTRISFDLSMVNHWEDGFDFEIPDSADLHLNLSESSTVTDPARVVRIGKLRWPVGRLPIKLQ